MGIVYEAIQESLDRIVAVKVLPTQMLLDEKRLKRFKREAQTAARLHHSNIVPVLGVGEHDQYHFYLMQRIDGAGVDRLLRQTNQSTIVEPRRTPSAETFVMCAAEAETGDDGPMNVTVSQPSCQLPNDPIAIARLTALCGRSPGLRSPAGICHRDIKPANLILDTAGVLWIADFGLSKCVESEEVTQTGDVLGTIRYMAPEQFLGEADTRSDIYSLGLTIYEILTHHAAHDENVRRQSFVRGQPAPLPRRPSEWQSSIPRDLETVVLKAIAHDPDDRYQSAADLASDLRCVVEDRPISARRASHVNRLWRWCRRNRALAASIITAIATTLLVVVISTLSYFSERELNRQLTAALRQVQTSLQQELKQRHKAERTSTIAWNALDEVFAQFAPRRADPGEIPADDQGPVHSPGPVDGSRGGAEESAAVLQSTRRRR